MSDVTDHNSLRNRYQRAGSALTAVWTRKQQGLPYSRRQFSRAQRRVRSLLREMGAIA
jgi:hypothetical protein